MKKTNITLSLGLIAILLLSSCGKNGVCVKGSGPVVSETRNLSSFDKIELDGAADIYISQGNTQSVVIEAQQNVLDILKTDVSSNKLNIDFKKNCVKNIETIKIYITVPDIRKIEVDGSGDIYGEGALNLEDIEFDIDGSGNITMMNLEAAYIGVNISGSGDVKFAGPNTCGSLDININGSGDIKAFDLPVNKVKIDIDGSGDCRVQAIQTLSVNISGSGNVYYKGNPQIDVKISGSGDLINAN